MSKCANCGAPTTTGKVACGECWIAMVNRLAAYEATGLTPEEVELYVKCQAMQMSKRELKLKIELEKVKMELEAAMDDIPHLCRTCGNGFYGDNGFDCDQAHYKSGCKGCLSWEWRGRREERYEAD